HLVGNQVLAVVEKQTAGRQAVSAGAPWVLGQQIGNPQVPTVQGRPFQGPPAAGLGGIEVRGCHAVCHFRSLPCRVEVAFLGTVYLFPHFWGQYTYFHPAGFLPRFCGASCRPVSPSSRVTNVSSPRGRPVWLWRRIRSRSPG